MTKIELMKELVDCLSTNLLDQNLNVRIVVRDADNIGIGECIVPISSFFKIYGEINIEWNDIQKIGFKNI